MIIAQVSLYPIGHANIEKVLKTFWNELENQKISYKITPLSTVIWSSEYNKTKNDDVNISQEDEVVFMSIFKAYKKARQQSKAVMVLTTTAEEKKDLEKLLKYI